LALFRLQLLESTFARSIRELARVESHAYYRIRPEMSQVASLGRTLLSPFTGAAVWFNNTAKAHPFATGVISTGVKTAAADVFAQKVIERRENFDWTRHAVFCTFGFAYLGAFQYYLYNIKFSQWCGPLTARFGHKFTSPIKVAIDQGLHHPFLYFPVFFSMKAVVSGKPLSSAVHKYRTEIWDSVKALWSVWVPAQLINFAFVPRHLRLPYVAAVSFGWTVILSVMQGKFDAAAQQQQEATASKSPALPSSLQVAAQQTAAAAAMAGRPKNADESNGMPALPSRPLLVPTVARNVESFPKGRGSNVEET
jgi:hypothetical protein